mmetsp:Transcript_10295/g.29387  ORF Transcript_10295/g.29387 Transcript_10295/m.29387 type:complete len:701 (-) Transcript_10295:123-2225(-)
MVLACCLQFHPDDIEGVIRPGCVLLGLEMWFRSYKEMRGAWMSLLSHRSWDGTLLDSSAAVIDLNIKGASYRVQNGQLSSRLPSSDGPAISSVEPLAVWSAVCETLALGLSRLGDSPFRVLLRCGGCYHQLEVVNTAAAEPPAMSTAVVRLPEEALKGMGWLEVLLDTADGSLVMSEAFPVLFTSVREVAEELNRALPGLVSDGGGGLPGLLEDMASCLDGGKAAPPRLLLFLAEQGLVESFKNLATSCAVLRNTEKEGQGLLGAAVLSGSQEMVDLVMTTLDSFRLPIDPCRRATDARGYTALHWAAETANIQLIYALLAEVLDPVESWEGCRARLCGKTPAGLMAEHGQAFNVINTQKLRDMDIDPVAAFTKENPTPPATTVTTSTAEAATRVWGSGFAAVLGRHPLATRTSLEMVYAVMLGCLGWRDPVTWWIVGLTFVLLQLLVPYVYRKLYLKGLAEARRLAAERGLALSPSFQFLGAPDEQHSYEQFIAQRASMRIFSRSMLTLGCITVFTAPAGLLLERFGCWRCTAGLVGGGALLPFMMFAICTGRVRWWRWLEPALTIYCRVMVSLPRTYSMITGNANLCQLPGLMSLGASKIRHLGVLPLLVIPVLSAGAFSMISQAPGDPIRWQQELFISLFGHVLSVPAFGWCISPVHGLRNLRHLMTVSVYCTLPVALLGMRLKTEALNLHAYLSKQ